MANTKSGVRAQMMQGQAAVLEGSGELAERDRLSGGESPPALGTGSNPIVIYDSDDDERAGGKRKRVPEAADHAARTELRIDTDDGCWLNFSDAESNGELAKPERLSEANHTARRGRPRSPAEEGIINGKFDTEIRNAHGENDDERAIADEAAALAAFVAGGPSDAPDELRLLTEAEVATALRN